MKARSALPRIASEAWWVAVAQALILCGLAFNVWVVARMLGPRHFGELNLAWTASQLAVMACFGPVEQIAARFVAGCRMRGTAAEFMRTLRKLVRRVALVVLAAGAVATILLGAGAGLAWYDAALGVGAAACACLLGRGAVGVASLNGARRRRRALVASGLLRWLQPLGAVAACHAIGPGAATAMLGWVVGLAFAVVLVWQVERGWLADEDAQVVRSNDGGVAPWKEMWSYGWPFAVWGAFAWLQTGADRWVIGQTLTASDVGLYAAVLQVATIPVLAGTAVLSQFLYPLLFERVERPRGLIGVGRLVFITAGLAASAGGLAVAAAATWHEVITQAAVGEACARLSGLLPLLLLGTGAYYLGQFLSLVPLAAKLPRALLPPKVAAGIIGVGVCLFAVPRVGPAGAGLASVVAGGGYLAWMVVLARRATHAVLLPAAGD